jgi:hypothetical protein
MGRDVETGGGGFPTIRIGEVKPLDKTAESWLVEGLWSWRAVGVLGGCPKSSKTWAAVDIALSVASGTKALEAFPVSKPGRVVFFAAEDPQPRIRERFEAIATRRGLAFKTLDVHLIDVPVIRLDEERDQLRLFNTLHKLRPRLLVLDPLVRIHRADENSASEISGLLSFLRSIERGLETAILIIHHTRKDAGSSAQPGQALRGSSDLWAFGDSNLYLRRTRANRLLLTIEHRSAPSPAPVTVALVPEPQPHLEVVIDQDQDREEVIDSPDEVREGILSELRNSPSPLRLEELRTRLRVRKQRVVDALKKLSESDLVRRCGEGFVQTQIPLDMERNDP